MSAAGSSELDLAARTNARAQKSARLHCCAKHHLFSSPHRSKIRSLTSRHLYISPILLQQPPLEIWWTTALTRTVRNKKHWNRTKLQFCENNLAIVYGASSSIMDGNLLSSVVSSAFCSETEKRGNIVLISSNLQTPNVWRQDLGNTCRIRSVWKTHDFLLTIGKKHNSSLIPTLSEERMTPAAEEVGQRRLIPSIWNGSEHKFWPISDFFI